MGQHVCNWNNLFKIIIIGRYMKRQIDRHRNRHKMLTVKHGDEQTYSQVNVMSNSKFVQRDRDKKIQKRNKERIVVMNPETDK
jgi:hypothetical protein